MEKQTQTHRCPHNGDRNTVPKMVTDTEVPPMMVTQDTLTSTLPVGGHASTGASYCPCLDPAMSDLLYVTLAVP